MIRCVPVGTVECECKHFAELPRTFVLASHANTCQLEEMETCQNVCLLSGTCTYCKALKLWCQHEYHMHYKLCAIPVRDTRSLHFQYGLFTTRNFLQVWKTLKLRCKHSVGLCCRIQEVYSRGLGFPLLILESALSGRNHNLLLGCFVFMLVNICM